MSVTGTSGPLTALGETIQLTATITGTDSASTQAVLTRWRSSSSAVAIVDSQGVVTARGNGTATITAAMRNSIGTTRVEVRQRASSVAVSPPERPVWLGWPARRLTVIVRDANANLIDQPTVSWESLDPTVARVDVQGAVMPVSTGGVTLRASVEGVSGTTQILVEAYGSGGGTNWRSAFMGGNWGTTKEAAWDPPADYFDFLADLNVNRVGISVALHVDDSMDATVERVYTGLDRSIATFPDESLIGLIRSYRQRGIDVYLTLAFEIQDAEDAAHPVSRWQLGDPNMPDEDPKVLPAFWPWDPEHPDHERFVGQFWESYIKQAVYFAKIAETEGVNLFSLGTETDRLFRTRPGGVGETDFLDELTSMITKVREVYSGLLTYDLQYSALTTPNYYGPGSDHLWGDLGLDVVGISAYFRLAPVPPDRVLTVADLEATWADIFEDYLQPLRDRNPGLPIVFTEFGYVDSLASPHTANAQEFEQKSRSDRDGNGLDDGEKTQANIYQAFFNTVDVNPGIVQGAFLWDTMMASEAVYSTSFGLLRGFNVRGKLAEDVVRATYAAWR